MYAVMKKERQHNMLFGRKKANMNEVCGDRVPAYLELRNSIIGAESFRCQQYEEYGKFDEANMKCELDSYLNRLLAGEVDAANGNMLDELIFGREREAMRDLNMQRIRHKDSNKRIAVRFDSDYKDTLKILEQTVEERDGIKEQYNRSVNEMAGER